MTTLSDVILRYRSTEPSGFSAHQRPTYVCRACSVEFHEYKGMRRVGRSSVGYCPDHLVPGLTQQEMNCWRMFGFVVEYVNDKVRFAR